MGGKVRCCGGKGKGHNGRSYAANEEERQSPGVHINLFCAILSLLGNGKCFSHSLRIEAYPSHHPIYFQLSAFMKVNAEDLGNEEVSCPESHCISNVESI